MSALRPLNQRTFATADAAVAGTVVDQGAQVTSWVVEGQDALWVSSCARFEEGQGVRGGVPICFPWFGLGRTGAARPKHGTARLTHWNFEESTACDDAVTATYSLPASTFPGRAFGLALRFEVTFGAELQMRLTVTNEGDEAASYEEALHTYFAVDDIRGARITGLEGVDYVDHADGKQAKTQDGDVVFTGQTDRVYARGGAMVLHGAAGGRTLEIVSKGAANTVVWNPWAGGTAEMADFADDEWAKMVCIEAANTLENAIELEPGAAHTLLYRVRVLA
ncbi:D-hexose-6-phosphate mutarotase [Trueperella pyogenes]|uniref:D-hexose-6-phosphate mutarotase n=1 Tax=Trueperella pyogenes TaxID=1661 RepID=UPI00345D7E64